MEIFSASLRMCETNLIASKAWLGGRGKGYPKEKFSKAACQRWWKVKQRKEYLL